MDKSFDNDRSSGGRPARIAEPPRVAGPNVASGLGRQGPNTTAEWNLALPPVGGAEPCILPSDTIRDAKTSVRNRAPGWVFSAVFHGALLVLLACLHVPYASERLLLVLRAIPDKLANAAPLEQLEIRQWKVSDDFAAAAESQTDFHLPSVALSKVQMELVPPADAPVVPGFQQQEAFSFSAGEGFARRIRTKGQAGIGTDNATFAIDRLTREILLSLEERPTVVVWLLDASASVIPQRKLIHDRLDRIYRELGTVQASGVVGSKTDKPLLSSVISFGRDVTVRTNEPTDQVERIKDAVAAIERDDSGIENVFQAILVATQNYREFRRVRRDTGQPDRNVMFIVFSDEAGDDSHRLEEAVRATREWEIPVFVVGVPAPFGQETTLVKWVDPDPEFDQTPSWGAVRQGPESAALERLQLGQSTDPEKAVPFDSGFGPFALTRLCYETGGIFFAVHPDRHKRRPARPFEVAKFTSHMSHFFDPDVMRKYRPEYVSLPDYESLVKQNKTRYALVQAAAKSHVANLKLPRSRFVVQNEADFARLLTESQKAAAVLEPQLSALYRVLQRGEPSRPDESSPRWQAGFDLAMGCTSAALARTKALNAKLAQAKRGMTPTDPKNNTWTIEAADDLEISTELQRLGQKAEMYLQRVVQEHSETPWSLIAQRELQQPMGWRWRDSFTPPPPSEQPRPPRPNVPRDDPPPRRLPRKPTRPVPRL